MITKETAARIWDCYREIDVAEKLLKEMDEYAKNFPDDPDAQNLRDSFERRRGLELGVPSGNSSRRLFGVPPELAKQVIQAHIDAKVVELADANKKALDEINTCGCGEKAVRCGMCEECLDGVEESDV